MTGVGHVSQKEIAVPFTVVSTIVEPDPGLSRTRRRTWAALVAAARDLVAEGVTPTVEEAAERAEVSRTTAYRYFPNRSALLVAAHPEVSTTSLLVDETAPADPAERLEVIIDRFLELVLATEAQQRTMLRLSLDPDPGVPPDLPLRKGRAIAWIAEALEPLAGAWSEQERVRLAQAIRATTGIEALVWLVDVAGLSREDAVEQMRWSARALLAEALRSGPPPVAAG